MCVRACVCVCVCAFARIYARGKQDRSVISLFGPSISLKFSRSRANEISRRSLDKNFRHIISVRVAIHRSRDGGGEARSIDDKREVRSRLLIFFYITCTWRKSSLLSKSTYSQRQNGSTTCPLVSRGSYRGKERAKWSDW